MRRLRTKAGAVAVFASAAMLLAACGGSSSSDGSSGSASGGSLDIFIAAQPNFPDAFATWSKELTAAFKAKTGADLVIETYASSADETTKIQTSIVAGSGPDLYNLGTTFTPVAYATGGFLTLTDDDWKKIGGRERFQPLTLGMSGPDEANQIGVPAAMRPFSLVYNTDMFTAAGLQTADDLGRIRRHRDETDQRCHRCLRHDPGLRRRIRPLEVHLGDVRAAGRLFRQPGSEDGGTEQRTDRQRHDGLLRSAHQVPPGRPGERRVEGR